MMKKDQIMGFQDDIEKFAFYFQKIMRFFHKSAIDALLDFNLSLPKYYALSLLEKAGKDKKYRMNDLKKDLTKTGAYATGIADYLIEKKLDRRGRWGDDRRLVMFEIVDEGKSVLKKINKRSRKFVSKLFNPINQEDIKRILESADIVYSAILKHRDREGNNA